MKFTTSLSRNLNRFSVGNSGLTDGVKRVWHLNEISDVYISPVLGGLITIGLLIVSCWGTRWLEIVTNDPRPFTLFFLVPVAFGSAYFGVSGGLASAVASIVIARYFLFPHNTHEWMLNTVSDDVEMAALAFGTFTVALVTGRLRTVLEKLRQANVNLKDSENRRHNFNREVLLAVTGGVLDLCDDAEIFQMLPGEPDLTIELNSPSDASALRHRIVDELQNHEFDHVRLDDLCTAATEAATNAVKHAGGGRASVWFRSDKVSVLIEDRGDGISPAQLARATLERGFSTRVSLGMGYYMMLESVDHMALSTSSHGTMILLMVSGSEKATVEQNILAHYVSA
jgi:anti-sigma regulatory factor (Ser/Thr protein kinase)